MGKREIRPLATPEPLNRSSQKVAHVIISWISTETQNLVAIPPGVSFPRMREIAHQNVYSASFFIFIFFLFLVLPTSYSLDAWTDIHTQYVKRCGSVQGCAFSGLEDKNLTFTPRNSRKTSIFWARLWRDLENFRPKTALQWGCSHVNSP